MKIDYDLIRKILLKVEEISDGNVNYLPEHIWQKYFTESCKLNIFNYHVKYLFDDHLIEGSNGYVFDITPTGRDYLNNVRDDNIWKKTKERIQPLGTVALGIVSEIAKSFVSKKLGLS